MTLHGAPESKGNSLEGEIGKKAMTTQSDVCHERVAAVVGHLSPSIWDDRKSS